MAFRPEYGPSGITRRDIGGGLPGAPDYVTPEAAALIAGEGVVGPDSKQRKAQSNGRPRRLVVFSGKVRDFFSRKENAHDENDDDRTTIVVDGDGLHEVDLRGNKRVIGQ